MAPEFFTDKAHSLGVDIWALGVLLYEMIHGNAPFGENEEKEKIECIKSRENQNMYFRKGTSLD